MKGCIYGSTRHSVWVTTINTPHSPRSTAPSAAAIRAVLASECSTCARMSWKSNVHSFLPDECTECALLRSQTVGRGSSVGIATCYGLEGPGSNTSVKRDLPHPSRPTVGPTQPPIQWYRLSFPELKRPGCGVNHPSSSTAEVKERGELYLYFPSGPSWLVLLWTWPTWLSVTCSTLPVYSSLISVSHMFVCRIVCVCLLSHGS